MESKEVIIVLGGPGSQRQGHVAAVARDFGISYLTTGDVLREYTAPGVIVDENDNPLDDYAEYPDWCQSVVRARETLKMGGAVDDSLVLDLVERKVAELTEERVFLDGCPRSHLQAEDIEQRQWSVKCVLFLEVPDSNLTEWLLESDVKPDVIDEHLERFHNEVLPVVKFYEEGSVPLLRVDGVGTADEVRRRILDSLQTIFEDIVPPTTFGGVDEVGTTVANVFAEEKEENEGEASPSQVGAPGFEREKEPEVGVELGSNEVRPKTSGSDSQISQSSVKRQEVGSEEPGRDSPNEGAGGGGKDDGTHYDENGELTERSRRRVLDEMVKQCLQKKQLGWTDEMLENFIGWMEKELTDLVEGEKYQEAKRPYAALTWALNEKQSREREKAKEQRIGKPMEVGSLDQELAEFDEISERKRKELWEEQSKYLAELDREWRDWRPETYRRPSVELREMRRNLSGLVALGRFDEASSQKARAEQLEKIEMEEAQRRLEADYMQAKNNLIRKQKRDCAELERKRALGREMLIAKRREQQRLADNRLFVIEARKGMMNRSRTSHGVGGERVLRRIAHGKPQLTSKLPPLKPPMGEVPMDPNDDGRPKAAGVVYRGF